MRSRTGRANLTSASCWQGRRCCTAGGGDAADVEPGAYPGYPQSSGDAAMMVTRRGHTEAMSDTRSPRITSGARLTEAAATLTLQPTVGSVQDAVAQAWRAAGTVAQPASPASALRWLRLVETLPAVWSDLAALSDTPPPTPPAAIPASPAESPGSADTTLLRDAVAGLIRTSAAVLRDLADASGLEDPDRGLRLALVGDLLDGAVGDWP